jgi:hypothetical protein
MAAFDQGEYQPIADDIYIQAVRAGRFNVHWHDGQAWQQLISISEQEAQALVAPMQFIGESKSKRQYYRPAIADVIERIEEASGHVF